MTGDLGSANEYRLGSVRRRLGLGALLAALAIAVLGCGPFNQPAYQVHLEGSAWSIEAIDGQPTSTTKPTIFFDHIAVIETGCRTMRLAWDMDSDGSGLTFDGVQPEPSCGPDVVRQDEGLAAALLGTDHWSVDSQDAIVLLGTHELLLRRMPSGS